MASILCIVSANTEWRAVKALLPGRDIKLSPYGEWFIETSGLNGLPAPVVFMHGGWGKISAAGSAQYGLDTFNPEYLFNFGTCGGFEGRIKRGTILVVEKTVVYDIYEQMGNPQEHIEHYSTCIDLDWLGDAQLPEGYQRGFLVSGDRDLIADELPLLEKVYGAYAGDWESGAIAWVAQRNRVRTLILRGVTDLVGPSGGEAYGNVEVFRQNTTCVMERLIGDLPSWLSKTGLW